jgi:hypothetical protein
MVVNGQTAICKWNHHRISRRVRLSQHGYLLTSRSILCPCNSLINLLRLPLRPTLTEYPAKVRTRDQSKYRTSPRNIQERKPTLSMFAQPVRDLDHLLPHCPFVPHPALRFQMLVWNLRACTATGGMRESKGLVNELLQLKGREVKCHYAVMSTFMTRNARFCRHLTGELEIPTQLSPQCLEQSSDPDFRQLRLLQ